MVSFRGLVSGFGFVLGVWIRFQSRGWIRLGLRDLLCRFHLVSKEVVAAAAALRGGDIYFVSLEARKETEIDTAVGTVQ